MLRTKIVRLPEANLFAYADERVSVKEIIPTESKKRFVVGNKYSLKGTECEGFTMRPNIYELVHVLESVNGIEFKSLIMKPIDVASTMIYSLTKQDCKNIGIPFQESLQLFPMELNWVLEDGKEVKEIDFNREFDDDDLSTYPVDANSKTVEHIIIRLVGFHQLSNDIISTPLHSTIHLSKFIPNLCIKYKQGNEPCASVRNSSLEGRIVTPFFSRPQAHTFVDNDTDSIFVEVNTQIRDMSNNKITGIDPHFLEGKKINDLFVITWIEAEKDDVYNALRGRRKMMPDLSWEDRNIYETLSNSYSGYGYKHKW